MGLQAVAIRKAPIGFSQPGGQHTHILSWKFVIYQPEPDLKGERVMSLRTFISATTGTLMCLGAVGCASEGPKPTDELTKAHTIVEQADKGGTAQRYAAADLQRAHDELSNAERLSGQKKYDEARSAAQRAQVDADLAVARGNSAEQQKAAADVTKANDALRHETSRAIEPPAATPVSTNPTSPPQF
jgi:hypothetical protein